MLTTCVHLSRKFYYTVYDAILPGPVIHEEPLTKRNAAKLPLLCRAAYKAASTVGVETKLIICRRPDMPACPQGRHEARRVVPRSVKLKLTGTTV